MNGKVTREYKKSWLTSKPKLLDKQKFNVRIFLLSVELITPENEKRAVITKYAFLNDH